MPEQLALSFETKTTDYSMVPLEKLVPHPMNPRPHSEKYGARVYDEKVEELVGLISRDGFNEPLTCRELPSGEIQILSGHHRWVAADEVGLEKVPCRLIDVDDKTAAMLLLELQGKEVGTWERARHAYECCAAYGGDGLFTISAYAEWKGKDQRTITDLVNSAKLAEKCTAAAVHLSVKAARQIATLPQEDWQWFTDYHIKHEWGEKERVAALKAVKEAIALNCPDWLTVIDMEKLKKKAVDSDNNGKAVRDAGSCIEKAIAVYESLGVVEVEIPDGEELKTETWDLQEQFIEAANQLPSVTPGKFAEIKEKLKKAVNALKVEASKWKKARAEGDELARLLKEQEEREAKQRAEYSPTGLHGDIRETLPTLAIEHRGTFDLVLTDPPYLLSNDGITARGNKQVSVNKNFDDASGGAVTPESWMPLCLQLMKPGGVLAFTCTEHLGITKQRLEGLGFEFLEKLYWIKRSAPPRLTPTGHRACVEEIWICRKPGEAHFFNYEQLKDEYWEGKQASNYLEFEQCSGNERLKGKDGKNLHDTQKPLKLWGYLLKAYSPKDGKVLDPFGGTGTTAVVAKQHQRIATWCEIKSAFFKAAQSRITDTKFFFED